MILSYEPDKSLNRAIHLLKGFLCAHQIYYRVHATFNINKICSMKLIFWAAKILGTQGIYIKKLSRAGYFMEIK